MDRSFASVPLSIRFWGVRGSIAVGSSEYQQVGGNTSCVEMRVGDELLIFDGGTGLRALGAALEPKTGHLFFSHVHWDHIQGFPFFTPAFIPGNHFTLHGPGKGAGKLLAALQAQMQPPTFPITLEAMGAQLDFSEVKAGTQLQIGPARILVEALNHPGGCLGYRVEVGGRSVVYATDFEPTVDGELDAKALALARGADLLICDAQYTTDEYVGLSGPCRKGWGHGTVDHATRLATEAGVTSLVLFHHDPTHSDDMLQTLESHARTGFADVRAAREGLRIQL